MNIDRNNSIKGCLFGGAIGDAMGRPFENKQGPLVYHDHSPWIVTDDTMLTLATCKSIIIERNVSSENIASQLLVMFRKRKIRGIGSSTLKALRDLDAGAHWALSGAKGEMSAGNGSAMRIAPLAFCLDPSKKEDREIIRDVSRITHHNEEAYVGSLAVIGAIHYSQTKGLFDYLIELLPDSRVRDKIIELNNLSDDISINEIGAKYGSSGYVAESIPLALYSAQSISKMSLEEIVKSIICVGGDTDTIGSIAGQIIGAWIGFSRLPAKLVSRLPNGEFLSSIADELSGVLKDE